jgi:LPPG:FO 2-phospho-L-lactate transferase
MPQPEILAIAGGVGGAKLALGLALVLPPENLTVVVNTGDDDIFHGLHVSPDLDSVTYALATHIRRTALLTDGLSLSQATAEITTHLGIECTVVPMTDSPVRTIAITDAGDLAFQEYFVHRGCQPRILDIRFDGADVAQASPAFARAIEQADAIIYCPSNPLVSIGPILGIPGVRHAIERFVGPRIAVSPIVGGQALKGPAAKMMEELNEEVSCVGVARRYMGLCDALVIDDIDQGYVTGVESCGMRAVVTGTIMHTESDKARLASEIIDLIVGWSR